ncbi:MAG: hypothetical protein EBQ87_12610 [Planctomycetes bacterium]|nr:hypothetical protein [Planctomycetota bacterium]
MDSYKKTVGRSLIMLALAGIILGWFMPSISCACSKTQQFAIPLTKSHDNIESFCCLSCIESQNCSCCFINENHLNSKSNTISNRECRCEFHTHSLTKSILAISNIEYGRFFKPNFISQFKSLTLTNSNNQLIFEGYNKYFFVLKKPIFFNLTYNRLNI